MSTTSISNKWETARTSPCHVTTASISSRHPFLKLHTVNLGTLNITMWKLDHDQTNSHSVINKSFGAKECWSYINIIQISTYSSWSKIYYKIFYSSSIYIYIRAGRCWNSKTDTIFWIENRYIRYIRFAEFFLLFDV